MHQLPYVCGATLSSSCRPFDAARPGPGQRLDPRPDMRQNAPRLLCIKRVHSFYKPCISTKSKKTRGDEAQDLCICMRLTLCTCALLVRTMSLSSGLRSTKFGLSKGKCPRTALAWRLSATRPFLLQQPTHCSTKPLNHAQFIGTAATTPRQHGYWNGTMVIWIQLPSSRIPDSLHNIARTTKLLAVH